MIVSPRYDGPPIMTMSGAPSDQLLPATRQRNRLNDLLASLDADAWSRQSRCDGWSVGDVVAHLIGVTGFFEFSIKQGLANQPTRLLAGFDPATTPATMVAAMSGLAPDELLARYVATATSLLATFADLTDAQWQMPAESPAGLVPIRHVVQHALWDCWIHERDIAVPLGLDTQNEPDEVLSCLRYAAAISPALAIQLGHSRSGSYMIEGFNPDAVIVLDVGDSVDIHDDPAGRSLPCLRGPAVELIEALSLRAPLATAAPDAWRHLIGGLEAAFDTES